MKISEKPLALINLSGKQTDHPESSNTVQQQEGRFSSHTSALNSLSSSSHSQSSSSSLGGSSGSKQLIHAPQLVIKQEASVEQNEIAKLKRENSAVELRFQEPPKPMVRSQSHTALGERPCLKNPSQLETRRSDVFKVKAVYGEEKVRFRLQPSWGFQELKQETMKRFNISDTCSVDLKYLDDDSEWVLLTCDADLKECIDVYKTSSGDTIKLSVRRVTLPVPRTSFSFPALS